MSLRIPRRLRAACAACALVVYALPMAVGLAAHIGHGAEHVLELMAKLERRAVAMGVAHLHDAPDRQARTTFVHAHGDAPHAHDAAVGGLLVAAQEAEEHADGVGLAALVEVSIHLPAAGTLAGIVTEERAAASLEPRGASSPSALPPPLPPPRA